eukprot:COSAG01_NODE_48_length_31904_cov_21.696997_14_plen_69_part_00
MEVLLQLYPKIGDAPSLVAPSSPPRHASPVAPCWYWASPLLSIGFSMGELSTSPEVSGMAPSPSCLPS